LITPREGEARFTSPMIPIFGPERAERRPGTAAADPAARRSSWVRGAKARTRASAAATNWPRVPPGGNQS